MRFRLCRQPAADASPVMLFLIEIPFFRKAMSQWLKRNRIFIDRDLRIEISIICVTYFTVPACNIAALRARRLLIGNERQFMGMRDQFFLIFILVGHIHIGFIARIVRVVRLWDIRNNGIIFAHDTNAARIIDVLVLVRLRITAGAGMIML